MSLTLVITTPVIPVRHIVNIITPDTEKTIFLSPFNLSAEITSTISPSKSQNEFVLKHYSLVLRDALKTGFHVFLVGTFTSKLRTLYRTTAERFKIPVRCIYIIDTIDTSELRKILDPDLMKMEPVDTNEQKMYAEYLEIKDIDILETIKQREGITDASDSLQPQRS